MTLNDEDRLWLLGLGAWVACLVATGVNWMALIGMVLFWFVLPAYEKRKRK